MNKEIEIRNEKLKVLLEKWADIEHKRWAKWQKYMHSKMDYFDDSCNTGKCGYILDNSYFDRWERQIATEYKDLSEKEKESDREQIYPYLEDVKKLLHKTQKQTKQELKERIIELTKQVIRESSFEMKMSNLVATFWAELIKRIKKE